ncbi:MAG: O-antigen ligase family protein [Caulobacter sp.]|nr:O-antigen ligase family protein [Caulobacter sp.]
MVMSLLLYSQGWILPLFGSKFDAASSAAIRNAYLPAYAAGVVVLAMRPWDTATAMLRQPFLIILMIVTAASVLWSIAPDATVRRLVALVATTLTGVVLAVRFRWSTMAEVMAATFGLLAVASLVSGAVLPFGRMTELFPGAWRGVWMEKNALGGNMAMAFSIFGAAAMLAPKRFWLWAGCAVIALALVLLSTSKTSLVSLVLGAMGLAFVWVVRRGPVSGVAATWAAVLGAGMLAAFLLFASDVFLGLLGKDATLTGRTKIWAAVLRQIGERPLTGYGFAAVWDDKSGWGPLAWITKEAGFKAQHAHNSWLEQWLGMGLFGVVAWGLFYIQTLGATIVAVFRDKGAYLALPFMVIYSLVSLTESIAVSYNDLRWVIFVALAVKLAWGDRESDA